ncbi:MAG: GlsB/YeaQ/YmgE family stress response membrane protein [Steroidobacteraceae bacterium]
MGIFALIGTIIVGLVVGALGRLVLPGEQKMGWFMTCLLGIAGSIVAGVLGRALGWYEPGEPAGWIASVLGAALVLFVVQKVRGGKPG